MKKVLGTIVSFLCACTVILSVSACGGANAELVYTKRTVGTFSGHRVDYAQVSGGAVICVVVEYSVDGVYLFTCPDPSWGYLLYTSQNDYLVLDEAYEQGLLTHDDLLAIAKAEEPYDILKEYAGMDSAE